MEFQNWIGVKRPQHLTTARCAESGSRALAPVPVILLVMPPELEDRQHGGRAKNALPRKTAEVEEAFCRHSAGLCLMRTHARPHRASLRPKPLDSQLPG